MTKNNIILRIKNRMASLIQSNTLGDENKWVYDGLLMQAKRFPEIHVAEVRAYFILTSGSLSPAECESLCDKINMALNPTHNKVAYFKIDYYSDACILETTRRRVEDCIRIVQEHINPEFEVSSDIVIDIPFNEQYIIDLRTNQDAEDYLESRELAFKIASV